METYPQVITRLGAELYLTLDNPTGTSSPDRSGHNRNGTLTGTYTLNAASGMADGSKATTFTAAGYGQISVPHNAAFNFAAGFGAAWSIVFRLKVTSLSGNGWPGLMVKGDEAAANGGWGIFTAAPAGEVEFIARGIEHPSTVGDATKVAVPGVWAHWALVYNGTDLRFYKDGALCPGATTTLPACTPTGTTPLLINKTGPWGNNTLDEVSLHSVALTATNITDLYNATLAVPTVAATAAFTGAGVFTAAVYQAGAVTDRITRIRGTTTPLAAMTVTLGAAVTGVEPFTTETITAAIGGTSSDDVTYTLTQTIGSPVDITGSGPTWTYRTPGTPTGTTAAQTRFQVTATKTGYTTSTATVDHYIYPAPVMDYDDTGAARGMSIQV